MIQHAPTLDLCCLSSSLKSCSSLLTARSALLVQVAGVKRIIETTQGQSVYPADNQLLIYQGKILNLVRQLSYLLICALELYVHPFT